MRSNRQNIISIADIFRAKIVDVSIESLVIELVGSQSKLERFPSYAEGC